MRAAIASVQGGAVTLVGNVVADGGTAVTGGSDAAYPAAGFVRVEGEYPAAIDLMARGTIRGDSLISAAAPPGGRGGLVREALSPGREFD